MINPTFQVRNIDPIRPIDPAERTGKTGKTTDTGFHQVLTDAIQLVEGAQTNASTEVDRLLTGKGGELHSAILATQRAELQFQLFLQVRNKVMNAYQQIMQVQV
jgi:flagellar hook-basal body complex protein FliE